MTGSRGPVSKPNARRSSAPTPYRAPAVQLPDEPPAHLDIIGQLVWREAAACTWVQASDALAVTRLAELEIERRALAAAVDEHGPLLSKPIITPKGDIAGTEFYANPAVRELRRLDTQIAELRKALGLDPMSRTRLGVKILEAESTLTRLLARRSVADDRPDPRTLHPTGEPI